MFFTRSWLEFQSSHSRQCVGSTKTGFPVEACTHPLSARRQGKTRECTSSFSCTLSCRLRSNGAVNIGYQSRIMALFCYCSRAQIFQKNTGRTHRRFALYQNSPISSSTHRKNSILMKRKPPISTRARLKSPNNPPRGRYRTGGLDDAALKVQQTSEAQFHGLLEENPDAIIIVDRTGHINFASNRIEAMFGYLPNELFGKPLSVLIPERYRDLHSGHLDRFMSDPKPRMMGVGLELHALRKDGSEFPTEISLSPHRTPDGLVVVAAIRDIEAAKRVQRLLLRELHHRVKNTLATVIAITSQSLRNATEPGRRPIGRRKPIGCLGQGA